jgi:hypothetical protein
VSRLKCLLRTVAVPPQRPNSNDGEEDSGFEADAVWENEIERVGERICTLVAGEGDGHHVPLCAERDGRQGEVSENAIQEVFRYG